MGNELFSFIPVQTVAKVKARERLAFYVHQEDDKYYVEVSDEAADGTNDKYPVNCMAEALELIASLMRNQPDVKYDF